MGKEKLFENKVKRFLKENGCYFVKYWGGGGFTKSGIPDLLVCCNGHFLGVELKAETGKPSDLQQYHIQKIRAAGGVGIVLYPQGFDDFKKMIEHLQST